MEVRSFVNAQQLHAFLREITQGEGITHMPETPVELIFHGAPTTLLATAAAVPILPPTLPTDGYPVPFRDNVTVGFTTLNPDTYTVWGYTMGAWWAIDGWVNRAIIVGNFSTVIQLWSKYDRIAFEAGIAANISVTLG
jgi:hypothetical protein